MSGVINKNNCKVFFLDYYEGNLSNELKNELFAFLEINSDLKPEFESFERVLVPESGKVYFDKDRLKKNTITTYNYKTWFIAFLENDLSKEGRREVEQFLIAHPALRIELELFKQTKITADSSVIFTNKNALKRTAKVVPIYAWTYRITAIAASLALLILFFYSRNNSSVEIAEKPASTEVKALLKENIVQEQHSHPIARPQVKHAIINKPVKKISLDVGTSNALIKTQNPVIEENTHIPLNAAQAAPPEDDLFAASVNMDSLKSKFKVFSDEEISEMKTNKARMDSGKQTPAGSNVFNKLLGDNIKMENKRNIEDSSSTFALVVGKFEFSRTVSR